MPDGDAARVCSPNAGATPPSAAAPVQFVDVFPRTPDRKVAPLPGGARPRGAGGPLRIPADPATGEYPLALISPASEKTISSTLGELRAAPRRLYMHPEDAAARGLTEGDAVRVFNALGEVHCRRQGRRRIRAGHGQPAEGTVAQAARSTTRPANALVPDTLTDLGGGACFNDARVEVARVLTAGFGEHAVGMRADAPNTGSELGRLWHSRTLTSYL